MTDTAKTKVEYLGDVVSQLKEMRHYAQSNTETLSAQWLAFDAGDYKDAELAPKISDLLNKQGALLEDIDSTIQDIEIAINHQQQEG